MPEPFVGATQRDAATAGAGGGSNGARTAAAERDGDGATNAGGRSNGASPTAAAGPSRDAPLASVGAAVGCVGVALPPTVVANAAVAERLGVAEEWIVSRTGIHERRVLRPGERLSDLATEAGSRTLERAGLGGADLDLLLVATTTQDEITPNTAPLVAERLGAPQAGALDVGAACTAFLGALAFAAGQVESGRAANALVIGADALTRLLDRDDRRTAGLFGDGAGAVLMTATGAPGRVGPVVLRSDGAAAELIYARRDEGKLRMQGHETFKSAVARLSEATLEALALAGLGLGDVDLFVNHQANGRILRAVGERLGVASDRVVDCIARYGNTSAASIPIALAEAEAEGRLPDGARVVLAAFGAGFTWGAGVVEWGIPHGA